MNVDVMGTVIRAHVLSPLKLYFTKRRKLKPWNFPIEITMDKRHFHEIRGFLYRLKHACFFQEHGLEAVPLPINPLLPVCQIISNQKHFASLLYCIVYTTGWLTNPHRSAGILYFLHT